MEAPGEPATAPAWLYTGLSIVAAAVAYEDPYQAIKLVEQIKPENARDLALARIGTFFIRNHPEEAEAWLTTASLSPSVVASIREASVKAKAPVVEPVTPSPSPSPSPSPAGVRPGLRAIRPNSG